MIADPSAVKSLTPEESYSLGSTSGVLILACGALAKEVVMLLDQFSVTKQSRCDLHCLPAKLHNTPDKIPNLLREKLLLNSVKYEKIFVAYADCGTGGLIDKLLLEFPNAERLVGPHCYASYSGQAVFDGLMEQELGSFFLTDYMVRFFDQLIIKGMGLDRHPQLRDTYFGHYKRVVYLAQIEDPSLYKKAERAAESLELEFEYHFVGMGELGKFVDQAQETLKNQKSEKE